MSPPLLVKMKNEVLVAVLTVMREMVKHGKLSRELPYEMLLHILSFMKDGWFYHKAGLQNYFERTEKSTGVNFSGTDFSALKLSDHIFHRCIFTDTDFTRTNCRGTIFTECSITEAMLIETNLMRAVIRQNCFKFAFLFKCKIHGTDMGFNIFMNSIVDIREAKESSILGCRFSDCSIFRAGDPEPSM